MKIKRTFYTELAYVVGIITLALGVAFMTRADFGLSMVVAPAYIVHLKIAETFSWFTFGMAEYCLQALLLILLALVLRKIKLLFLLSFVTAVVYGFVLDGLNILVGFIPDFGMLGRVIFFVAGMLLCALGVSMFFHTYLAPEAYELVVKELTGKFNANINKVKTIYDCISCLVAIILSFAFFGFLHFEGVKVGTVICALINGWIIGRFSKFFEKHFEFKDGLQIRKWFE